MIALLVLILILMSCAVHYWYSRRRLRYLASKLPGPPTLPIFGNSLSFIGSSRKIFQKNTSFLHQYGLCCRIWLGPILVVTIGNPQDVEIVLRNTKTFDKGWFYNFLKPWLGNGLITSKGKFSCNSVYYFLLHFYIKFCLST
ncbi:hypothetical protein C0J52_10593 [Blattella germanica]|nr:hypothetical protein C0J52_10593 [Blattella germanica]